MSTYKPEDRRPIETLSQLKETFVPSSPKEGRVGVEWELLPIGPNGRMVPYAGAEGVEALFGALRRQGNAPVVENGRVIALRLKGGGMAALEPGAQVEIASRPSGRLGELGEFLNRTLESARREARALGFDLCPWGLAPNDGPEANGDVPKTRYAILKKHLESSGDRGRWMMKLSAATQISMDYMDEEHLRRMVDGCLKLAPYLVAATANAPAAMGRRSRWMSLRPAIWRRTDPRRCGLPRHLFSEKLGYGSVFKYAIERPPLFFVREERWVRADGRSFKEILKRPGRIGPLTMDDWMLHLSALFPDIRIRGYMEVRFLDSLPLPLVISSTALLKGLLGGAGNFEWAKRLPKPEKGRASRELLNAARSGAKWLPEAGPAPKSAWPIFFGAAKEGLESFGESASALASLERLAASGRCPAEEWRRERFGWAGPRT